MMVQLTCKGSEQEWQQECWVQLTCKGSEQEWQQECWVKTVLLFQYTALLTPLTYVFLQGAGKKIVCFQNAIENVREISNLIRFYLPRMKQEKRQ